MAESQTNCGHTKLYALDMFNQPKRLDGCLLCERDRLRDALGRIRWVKDCGIDGKDEQGNWVNFAADERDAMYEIASEALTAIRP